MSLATVRGWAGEPARDGLGLGPVTLTEEDGVHEERVELEQGDPFLPSGLEGAHFLVGRQQAVRHPAEQGEHGEILLGVPPVHRGIDEPRPAVNAEEDVAPPEIAVQQRRTAGREQLGEPGDDAAHCIFQPATCGELPETGSVEGGAVRPR